MELITIIASRHSQNKGHVGVELDGLECAILLMWHLLCQSYLLATNLKLKYDSLSENEGLQILD
jgi:hypothetical protein